MSSRDGFWFLAGALVAFCVIALVRWWPLGRRVPRPGAAIPSFAVPVAAGFALLGTALGIYLLLGATEPGGKRSPAASARAVQAQTVPIVPAGEIQHNAESAAVAGSLDEVTRRLADRLAARGGTDSEWQLLAQSYDYMGRSADARSARAHVGSAARSRDSSSSGATQDRVEQIAAVADSLDGRAPAAPSGGRR
jgi:hypothetical protein